MSNQMQNRKERKEVSDISEEFLLVTPLTEMENIN